MTTNDEFDPVELQALLDKAKALRGDISPRTEAWEHISNRIEALRVRELPGMLGNDDAANAAPNQPLVSEHALPARAQPARNTGLNGVTAPEHAGTERAQPARITWRSRPRTAMLAAAALFVAVTATAVLRERDGNRATDPDNASAVAVTPAPTDTSMAPVYAKYDAAAEDLSRDLNQRRTGLNPETVAVLDSCLSTIDNAIRESRSALATTPGNLTIAELLQVAYEQKLDLLRRAAELPLGSL